MQSRRTACHALFLAATVAACLTAMTRAEAGSRTSGHGDMQNARSAQTISARPG